MKTVLSLCLAVICGAALVAQRGPGFNPPPFQQPPPQFRSRVDLVHLDVSVLDGNRRPVRDLGPADFRVFENGVPQTISVFSAVDIPDPVPPTATWMREVASDVRVNSDTSQRRLFLIIIDDAAVSFDVYAMKNVKDIARRVIDGFGPSDLAAVVFTADNRNSQDFTSDRSLLLKAVDKYSMGGPINGFLSQRYSVGVVQSAVKVLSGLNDRRKAIIYIGQGVSVDLAAAAEAASAGLSDSGGGSSITIQGDMSQLAYMMSLAFRDANRANINVYALDVCGLRVEGPPGTCPPGLQVDYLNNIAVATGARAVVNTNDFAPGVAEIFAENASYYLLGYQSTNPAMDGKLRRLEVRVNRPGMTVRTRSGYQAERLDDAKRKAELAKSPLGAALAGVLPKVDLPMRLTAAPFATPGKKEASVLLVLGVTQPIRQANVRTIERVDLQVRAFNTDGKQLAAAGFRADVAVRAGASGLAEYEVLARMDLKPGRYQLRTAANVGALATSGSLYYDLEVPDIGDLPVSLSGLVLLTDPALPSGGIKNFLPVSPTTQRRFGPGSQVSAFLRVYAGGRNAPPAVPLRVRLRSGEDVLIMDRREVIKSAALTAERFANVNIALPMGRLAAGEYLLTVETTTGKKDTSRAVRFVVDR